MDFVIRTSAFALSTAYHNRAISTMQVIEELIKLAKDRGKCRMANFECRTD